MLMLIDPLTILESDDDAQRTADAIELILEHELIEYDELDRILDDADPIIRFAYDIAYERCPIHHCDYRICDDDDDPECRFLRIHFYNLIESIPD